MNNTLIQRAALAAVMCVGLQATAWAQSQGDFLFRIGQMTIKPQVNSGEMTAPSVPNVKMDVGGSTTLGGGIGYMLTDHWALDVPLAVPFKHHIYGAGAISGSGEIGTTKVVPATLFAQYHFYEPTATWRPYVGLGLTYAKFIQETGNGTLTALTNPGSTPTTMDIGDKFGYTLQAGMTYSLTSKVYLELMVGQTFLKAKTKLSTGQTLDAQLNPWIAGWYVGYRY
jgi:outer membrane protein